jgi:hypothetical protein
MSDEKYEYAEKILVKLRDMAKESSATIGEIIGEHQNASQNQRCGFCSKQGMARISANGQAWFGNCCRNKLPNQWSQTGQVSCAKCNTNNRQGRRHSAVNKSWGICNPCISNAPNSNINSIQKDEIDKELKTVRSSKAELKKSKLTTAEMAKPYIDAGLDEQFALAIARGTDNAEILDLWESEWWKQYPPDDIIIVSVLTGELTEDDARTINEFRGEHPELAMACIQKSVSVGWATMLLDSGFEEHSDAVRNVLAGADPVVIARIRKMEVNKDAIPPLLSLPILAKKTGVKGDTKSRNSVEVEFMATEMSEKQWAKIFSTYLKGGAQDTSANRHKLQAIYGRNWVASTDSKKSIELWATFFNIKNRSSMNKKSLVKEIRAKAGEIRAFVRTQLP